VVPALDEYDNVPNTDANQYTIAYNYNLSKRTKVYTFYTNVDDSSLPKRFAISMASSMATLAGTSRRQRSS